MEVETQRGRFTWKGLEIVGYDYLNEKLDRTLYLVSWRLKFAETYALTKAFSNHHPILITLHDTGPSKKGRPFRFENVWLTHKEFQSFLEGEW